MRRAWSAPLALTALALCTPLEAATPAGAAQSQAAPKPARLPDGKPNWTGFWTPVNGLLDRNLGPGAKVTAPPAGVPRVGGQMPPSPHSPLKSPYKERYEARLAASLRGEVGFDPTALCLPPGMPRMMGAIYGMELLQTPGQVTITSEGHGASRRIWTDGRAHPPADELLATYAGHSIGRWEKDVLVVDTVGVRDDVLIDQAGLPVTETTRITERFQQREPGILVDEITVDDPTVFTEPWTQVRRYRYRPELSLQEFVCLENNRNVGPDGEPSFK